MFAGLIRPPGRMFDNPVLVEQSLLVLLVTRQYLSERFLRNYAGILPVDGSERLILLLFSVDCPEQSQILPLLRKYFLKMRCDARVALLLYT